MLSRSLQLGVSFPITDWSKEYLEEVAKRERKYQKNLRRGRGNTGHIPENGHRRDEDGVSGEGNVEADAVKGLAEEAPRWAGGEWV